MAFINPSHAQALQTDYPWTMPSQPLISSAPMRLISTAPLALAVSRARGLGFLAVGTDVSIFTSLLSECSSSLQSSPIPNTPSGILAIGVGFICWGASLPSTISVIQDSPLKPAAAWLFAPEKTSDLIAWSTEIRKASSNKTKIWVQVGTVSTALEVAQSCKPDVLVIQGSDAGGHGLVHSPCIISLLPECVDALASVGVGHIPLIAAGGIMESRGFAAVIILGASGVSMGTRFLASPEASISQGYRDTVIHAKDGGISTKRTKLYDRLRGTHGWPEHYDARGILNDSYWDDQKGMSEEENRKLYEKAVEAGDAGWGKDGVGGRMTTYAGTGVGLVKNVKGAGDIVKEIREGARKLLGV